MRKFLCDRESVVTIEEIEKEWEAGGYAADGVSLEAFMRNCAVENNGALEEILTAETPVEKRRGAVMLCAVYSDGDDAAFPWVSYLTAVEIAREKKCGRIVTAYLGKW